MQKQLIAFYEGLFNTLDKLPKGAFLLTGSLIIFLGGIPWAVYDWKRMNRLPPKERAKYTDTLSAHPIRKVIALTAPLAVIGIIRVFFDWDRQAFILLGVVPAFMLGSQAFTLFGRNRWVRIDDLSETKKNLEEKELGFLSGALDALNRSGDNSFPSLIAMRFVLPALFILLACGFAPPYLQEALAGHTTVHWRPEAANGAIYGFAGAYVYVVLYLGGRSLRFDITAGSASISAMTLASGPVVAGLLGMFLGDAQVSDLSAASLGKAAVYFVAGFSPRYIVSYVTEAVRRLYPTKETSSGITENLVPLRRIRGISAAIEERLAEEGIDSVSAMATVNPVRLLQNTSYDRRQIVHWIDQALLMEITPKHYQDLLDNAGIDGAIALARLETNDPLLAKAATATKFDKEILCAIADRLHGDPQVRLVWALYEMGSVATKAVPAPMAMLPVEGTKFGVAPPAN